MLSEPAITEVASSWLGLFAAIWLNRDRTVTPGHPPEAPARRHRRSPARVAGDERRRDRSGDWERVDLFMPAPEKTGRRFDDTVAWPLDTRRLLYTTIDTVARRLRALPEPHDLGRRSARYRAQLQLTLRDARQALARLDEGTYGTCIECASPISLATLTEKPWASVCAWCAADVRSAHARRAPTTEPQR